MNKRIESQKHWKHFEEVCKLLPYDIKFGIEKLIVDIAPIPEDKSWKENIAKNINKLREKNKLSFQELADEIGIDRDTLKRLAYRNQEKSAYYPDIAKALNTTEAGLRYGLQHSARKEKINNELKKMNYISYMSEGSAKRFNVDVRDRFYLLEEKQQKAIIRFAYCLAEFLSR